MLKNNHCSWRRREKYSWIVCFSHPVGTWTLFSARLSPKHVLLFCAEVFCNANATCSFFTGFSKTSFAQTYLVTFITFFCITSVSELLLQFFRCWNGAVLSIYITKLKVSFFCQLDRLGNATSWNVPHGHIDYHTHVAHSFEVAASEAIFFSWK